MKENGTNTRLEDLIEWEHRYFTHEGTDLGNSYQKMHETFMTKINNKYKRKVLSIMDTSLVHLQAWLLHSRSYEETKRRVITQARIFDTDIRDIEDLQQLPLEQLDYIAEQLMAKQRLLALGQGGLTGMGGFFLVAADLPAMAVIQLRSLQHLALVYGYDSRHPVELIIMLKLFYIATLPKAYQSEEWDKLFEDVKNQQFDYVFYQGDEAIFREQWFEQLTNQLVKSFIITMLRKKVIQGIPLVGMAVGAGMNYRFSQQVIEIGQHFYQKRRMIID